MAVITEIWRKGKRVFLGHFNLVKQLACWDWKSWQAPILIIFSGSSQSVPLISFTWTIVFIQVYELQVTFKLLSDRRSFPLVMMSNMPPSTSCCQNFLWLTSHIKQPDKFRGVKQMLLCCSALHFKHIQRPHFCTNEMHVIHIRTTQHCRMLLECADNVTTLQVTSGSKPAAGTVELKQATSVLTELTHRIIWVC